uniref:BED-type domain-containing protein n=1 Tax=Romanomermis culicivorax TaxID=13658 RepID=A0A915L757_ROMCU
MDSVLLSIAECGTTSVPPNDEEKAKSNKCRIQLSRKGRGTGCQRTHLERKHMAIYEQFAAKQKEDNENRTVEDVLKIDAVDFAAAAEGCAGVK